MNQKKSIALTTTFVGLVCGFVLTQQQAAAADTNAPGPTATSMVTPRSTATAKPAEPTQKEQPVHQQTSTQKAVTSTDTVSETVNQNQIPRNQSTGSPAKNTSTQSASSSNNTTTSAPKQQETAAQNTAATSSANSANETTQPVSQPTIPATPQANKATNSANNSTDPQVETIAQGTWGTSKWEYTHQGDDYILHFHAGTLGASSQKTIKDPHSSYLYHCLGSIGASPEIFNGNWQWNDALTQIIIDPGVIANRDSGYLFGYLKNLKKIVGLANLDTMNVTNMSYMFNSCQKLTSLDLSDFNTTNVTNMSNMLCGCFSLTSLDISNFNTANVTDMSWMFGGYQGASLDLNHFNTANVTNMAGMFNGYQGPQLDFNNFDTSKVTDMSYMFAGCGLTSLNLNHFNTANVTDMSYMFYGCNNITSLDLNNFNTSKVTDMHEMFRDCYSLNDLNVNNFKFNDTDLTGMFQSCYALTSLDLSNWDTTSLDNNLDFDDLFLGATKLNHLILGAKTVIGTNDPCLQGVPNVGTRVPGTNRVVASPYWVATSGYQQGHKYNSGELMELTGRDQVTTYDWDSKPAFTQTTETKTKVRTINLHQPNGQLKTETQTVAVSCPVTINQDGSKTYDAWTTAQWDQYTVPEWAGYQASQKQVPATTVSGDSANTTIDIYYQPLLQNVEIQYLDQGKVVGTQTITGYTGQTLMPNYQAPQGYEIVAAAPATITIDATGHQIIQVQVAHKINNSTEFNALTRTVNIHRPDGTMKTYIQTAVLKRNVYIDGVTGAKTYGAWSTDNWDAVQIPVFAGYTASQDQVAAQLVTGEDSDQTVDVYYTPTNTNWF